MKSKKNVLYGLVIVLTGVMNFPVQAQQKTDVQDSVKTESLSQGPKGIVRTIKQDRKGNIWITSWEGVYKYDGKSFTNVTRNVSSARFFSVLEDRNGNFWFASIGSGVYYYDGKTFQNFTTRDGLASDRVTVIYEDKSGNVWFGTEGGASRYDGKNFQTLKMNRAATVTQTDSVYTGSLSVHAGTDSVQYQPNMGTDSVLTQPNSGHTGTDSVQTQQRSVHLPSDSAHSSGYQQTLSADNWMHNDVNAIIEDKSGKFWFGTRGYATIYDGKTFTTIIRADGKPFLNVRSIIKDKKDNIWLGGNDGLWRYDSSIFKKLSQNFVGYIYEDRKGNIWISSGKDSNAGWTLARYDEKSLSTKKPTLTTVVSKPMIFGILEDDKGNIWFGDFEGVHRYDGKNITDFRGDGGRK